MGLAIVSLIVLAILGAIGGLVLARIVGAAAARNEDRPGGGGSGQGPGGGDRNETGKEQAGLGLLIGGGMAALGALMGVAGAVSALFVFSLPGAVSAASVGILLGIVGYYLGAHRLGRAATVLCAVALLFGVAASQGLVPGLAPTDHQLPASEPRSGG